LAILEILTYPSNILKNPTKPVKEIDEKIHELIENMAETMFAAPGVGLAANQVGIDKSIIVYNPAPFAEDNEDSEDKKKNEYHVLINPEIISSEDEFLSEDEGCLSVPELTANVKRAAKITVKGLNIEGEPVDIEAEDYLAVVLQHEIDHLNGILFIDRISALKRGLYKRKVKKRLRDK